MDIGVFSCWAFFTAGLSAGQSLSLGIKGGIRTTDDLEGISVTSESKRYRIGPTVDLTLPLGFGVEFDALYSREGYRSSYSTALYTDFTRERANSWELPVLLKYRIGFPIVKPYVEAGVSTRILHGSIDGRGSYLSGVSTSGNNFTSYQTHGPTNWSAVYGFVAGGGVQFRFGQFGFSPELRYTHWNDPQIRRTYPDGPSFGSTQNQLDVLVGLAWKVR